MKKVQQRTQELPQHSSSPPSIIVHQNGSFYMRELILVCLIENSTETMKIQKQHQRCILHRWAPDSWAPDSWSPDSSAPDSWALDSGQLGPGKMLTFLKIENKNLNIHSDSLIQDTKSDSKSPDKNVTPKT